MHRYKHILAGTDFSELSEYAVEQAVRLAGHYQAELTLLHVIEHFPEDLPNSLIAPEDIDPKQFLIERAEADLGALALRAGNENARKVVRLTTQSAKVEIVRYAEDREIDLIVLGAHSRHGIRDLLGSTAGSVLSAAPCDVLAVRGIS
jgi:universal stress protein A